MSTVDLSNCELEPIRFPGAVQPHGALLVLRPAAGIVDAASESCQALLGLSAESLLGQAVGSILGPAAGAALLAGARDDLPSLVSLSVNGRQLGARSHLNAAGQVLVDIEADDPDLCAGRHGSQARCRRVIEALRRQDDVTAITRDAAAALRAMTGFDRVMVYRFDAAWNGEVVAESCTAGLEPYLGLNFPASDIPRQARELFQSCRLRLIPDVLYRPSDLIAGADARAIDLGQTGLRSVSPMHIEYLTNMAVRATLVGALVAEGNLWGLVVCHHTHGPKHLGPSERDALGWLCENIGALVEARLIRQRRDVEHSLALRRRRLVEAIRSVDLKALMRRGHTSDLLDVVGADGFALIVDDSIQTTGNVPDTARIRELQRRRLECQTDPTLFATSALTRDLGMDDAADGVAGAILVSVREDPATTLIWFRKERRHSVRWAGDPDHAHVADDSGRLSPRKSFAQFLQGIRGQSLAWSLEELESAAELRGLIEIELLREEQALAQTILNSSPENIAVIDARGVIASVNTAWRRFAAENDAAGLAENSVGLNYRSICAAATGAPDGAEALPAWSGIEAVLNRTLDHFSLDYPCDSPTQRRWFRMNVYPMIAPNEGAVVTHVNITERKLAEVALGESEQRFRHLIDRNNAVILQVDPASGRILDANASACRFYGWSHARMCAMSVQDINALEPEQVAIEREAAATEQRNYFVFPHRLANGETRTVEVHSTPIRVGDRSLLVSIIHDITERSLAEAEVAMHRHHLQRLVEDRTVALTIAKEVAEGANRAKTAFLAKMSHELRTPMNAIMGMTSLALREASEPRQIDHLRKVAQGSQRLLRILNDILDISKLEADRLELDVTAFRLGSVFESLLEGIGEPAAKKGLALVIDVDPELAALSLQGDPLRLEQILLNLAGNAIKFTAEGSVVVRALLVEETAADVRLRIEIRDTGCGISAADQKRIFSAFEQADNSLRRPHGGNGLGLTISRQLATMMGGAIGVESEAGAGSTFSLSLRLARLGPSAPASTDAGMPDHSSEDLLRARHAGTRILLAEDDRLDREVTQALIELVGLAVDLAESGAAAVEKAKGTDYGLILLDLQMPVMDGPEATRRIRRIPGRERTPVIALTGSVSSEVRADCLAAGMNDLVTLPVDLNLLCATMLAWLDKRTPAGGI